MPGLARRLVAAGATMFTTLALGSAPALAADAASRGREAASAPTGADEVRASRLLGADVRDAQGSTLGRVQDVLVDPHSARVRHVLIGPADPAAGTRPRAVPLSALKVSREGERLVPTVDGARLTAAPGAAASPDGALGAAELIGRAVKDSMSQKAGALADLVVTVSEDRVHYAVVDFDKEWSIDDKLLALPISALRFDDLSRGVQLSVPREKLDMAKGFEEAQWPEVASPAWQRRVDDWLASLDQALGTDRERRPLTADRSAPNEARQGAPATPRSAPAGGVTPPAGLTPPSR